MAEEYLAERAPEVRALRFDVIGILLRSGRPEITHIEDAF